MFYAYKLTVSKSLCVKDQENIKRQTSENKLVVENGLIKLPPPDELKQGWQSGSANFPDTTDDEVDKYLIDAPKSDFEGKELGKLWTCFQCGVPHCKSQLKEIRVQKAKNRAKSFLCMREQKSVDRSSFDPCSLKDRTPMHLADIDWENLALASNGNCGILLYKNPHLSCTSQEPDISHVVHEEIVST